MCVADLKTSLNPFDSLGCSQFPWLWRELSPCWTRQLLAPEVPRALTHWSTSLNRCPPLLGTGYHQTPQTPPAHWTKYSVKCNSSVKETKNLFWSIFVQFIPLNISKTFLLKYYSFIKHYFNKLTFLFDKI